MKRHRRLRKNKIIRGLIRETRISKDSLIYPIFFREGKNIYEPIESLDGQYRYSPDMAGKVIDEALESGVNKFLLFGIPKDKDEIATSAFSHDGVIQDAMMRIKEQYKDEVYLIGDVCMCEYTNHGHCGIIKDREVDNDATLEYLAKIALSQAQSGADMIAPSDMMDGRVGRIREELDKKGYKDIPIMSYAIKYASKFYSPFRDAAGSAPSFGDRNSYQMDFHNIREALNEGLTDIEEGADILIVKPMLSYLDVVREIFLNTNLPIATYSVSGEYAMIKNAHKNGLIDEYGVMIETSIAAFRAGADILITYFAKELSKAIQKGDIG